MQQREADAWRRVSAEMISRVKGGETSRRTKGGSDTSKGTNYAACDSDPVDVHIFDVHDPSECLTAGDQGQSN